MLSRPIRASMRDRPCAADQIIGPGRPGHRRTVTPSLGRRRYTRLPTDWTATMRRSTRLHSQLTRSLRRMQFAALPPGDYSPPLRSPGSQRTLQAVRQQHVDALSFAYYLPNLWRHPHEQRSLALWHGPVLRIYAAAGILLLGLGLLLFPLFLGGG